MKNSSSPPVRCPHRRFLAWNRRKFSCTASLSLLVVAFMGAPTAQAAPVAVEPGWNLVANQCVNANTIATIFPMAPVGSLLLKANNSRGTFEPLNVFSSGWSYPAQTLAPGEGAWFYNPTPGAVVFAVPGVSATPQLPLVF